MTRLARLVFAVAVGLQLLLVGGVSASAAERPLEPAAAPLIAQPPCSSSYATPSGGHYLEVYIICTSNTYNGRPYEARAVASCKRSNGTTFTAYSPYFTPTTGVYATCSTNGSAWAISKAVGWRYA